MSVTIKDVAERAGVSVATASRALSGGRGVRPANRERVLRAARELDYEPNAVAAALRSRTTNSIGIVVPRISNPFFATLVEAVEREAARGGRGLLLAASQYDPGVEEAQLRSLLDRRVDALIAVPCHREHSRAAIEAAGRRVPTVQLDLCLDGGGGSWVGVDSEAGILASVEHLVAAGARTLAYVGSEPTDSSAQARLDGFRGAAPLCPGGAERVLLGDFSLDWGHTAARRLLERPGALPEGIVCGNDTIALGVLRELARGGVDVPGRVMVTGFDDISFAELAEPPLTTVRQPQEQLAAEAVRTLTDRLGGGAEPHRRVAIAPELVIRGTTRPTG
ncbi:LacI family DNA-binding transcriptional regulator [Nocardiopsis baichengensis]|uniref:LacI family DNA-binding transcriptional regulator n=1 Tax=Nocardiopsis baichengensis TaxID=280240 RepID=UPI000347925F|nr:LacI family DNA-binding transcriptional regulator [Nocardiopsis baichengensis]